MHRFHASSSVRRPPRNMPRCSSWASPCPTSCLRRERLAERIEATMESSSALRRMDAHLLADTLREIRFVGEA